MEHQIRDRIGKAIWEDPDDPDKDWDSLSRLNREGLRKEADRIIEVLEQNMIAVPDNCVKFYGNDNKNQWYSYTSAGTWKTCDPPTRVSPDLLAALKAFTAAMDMHVGHAHEVAICEADDMARAAMAKATT